MTLSDLGFRCRPIDAWPGELTKHRKRSQFHAQWGMTLKLLGTELRQLGAKNGNLLSAVDERDILLDGTRPRAKAYAAHPGVILAFDSKHGPLKYACDRFDHWQDNIRAIALGLEALRAVERYAITRKGEQYQGFKQLAASTPSREEAAGVLAKFAGMSRSIILEVPEAAETAGKRASRLTHPDAGGNADDFRAVQQAREILAGVARA
jgi:hypothetical protein